ncbi:hypothetical protein AB0M28_14625 [Streptomyces sp. NPDC051940]|uniref:hypothetical protein n=1 Tax=Streptomyces sp. NPDC051940 TaxID=3155675 RepID=UPI0034283DEF
MIEAGALGDASDTPVQTRAGQAVVRVLAPPRTSSPTFVYDRGRYTTFDLPDGRIAEGAGIDDRGRIVVGAKTDDRDSCDYRGYLRDPGGRYTRVDVPGAAVTNPLKISDRGEIAGNFRTDASCTSPLNGFLRDRRGRFVRIRFPGSAYTQAAGVNDRGQVVGEYGTGDGASHGFVWQDGRYRTADVPGAAATSLLDVNDSGATVGVYVEADGSVHAFVRGAAGRVTVVDRPGAVLTLPFGINNRGQIAGFSGASLQDVQQGDVSGFVLRQGADGPFTPVEVPGATGTGPFDINDLGVVVGQYANPDVGVSSTSAGPGPASPGSPYRPMPALPRSVPPRA